LRAVAADAARGQPSAQAAMWRRARRWAAAAHPEPNRHYVYTYPFAKAIKAVTATVKTICRRTVNQPLQTLIRQLNLRCGAGYFRPGVSAATFPALSRYTLDRILRWARRKHQRITFHCGRSFVGA
jgi:hypothetical protein